VHTQDALGEEAVEAAARKHKAYKQAAAVMENRRCRRELTKRHAGSFSALLPRQEARDSRESGHAAMLSGVPQLPQLSASSIAALPQEGGSTVHVSDNKLVQDVDGVDVMMHTGTGQKDDAPAAPSAAAAAAATTLDFDESAMIEKHTVLWGPLSKYTEIKDGMVGRAQMEWDYRRNVGSTLVSSLVIDDKMRVHEMSLRILRRGYQGFNIGFSQLVRNETSWADPKCLNKVWWFDSSTGVLFNGPQRLNEPQRRAVEVKQGQEKEEDDHLRGRFDEGDELTLLLDLGYHEKLGGLMKVCVNGQQVCACEGVLGPVRLTVQLLNQLDEIADASYRELSRSAVIRGMSNKEAATASTPLNLGSQCVQQAATSNGDSDGHEYDSDVSTDVDQGAQEELGMSKGDTVAELHALHAAALRIQNQIDQHVHVLQTSSGERQERESVGDGAGVDAEESLLAPTALVLRKRERGGGKEAGRKDVGEQVSAGEKTRDMADTVKRIRQGARDLSRMMWRIGKLEKQRALEEALIAETPAGMRQRNAELMGEVEAMRAQLEMAEQQQELLQQDLQERQYALAKARHRQTCIVRGKIALDMLVAHPLTEEEVTAKEDDSRENAILQRKKMFEENEEGLRSLWLRIADNELEIRKRKVKVAEIEDNKNRQLNQSKIAVTAALRAAARTRATDLDRLIVTTKINMKSLYKQRDVLNAKVRQAQNAKSRIIQVLTSLTKISVDQSKERERLSRKGRHEDGRFTPIVLTTAHQSPGHHVYDRHETLTKDQRSLLTLQGRNARSAGLTPLLATVIEKEASLDAAEPRIPHYPGARRSMLQRMQQLRLEEAAAKAEATKQEQAYGVKYEPIDTKQEATIVMSNPGSCFVSKTFLYSA
jgi:hypothetical protein